MPKISVILPLYNAARFLAECLKSIQNQTFQDFELICVNDASTDDTMQILQDFQKEDKRIRIFSNPEHSGAAYSRNRGMKEAVGKYLSFLDGDDIFEEEMLECACRTAEKYHTDVLMFERKHVSSENIYNKQQVFHSMEFRSRYCDMPFEMKEYMPYEILRWQMAPASQLYNKDFIESNHLEFQNLSCANDVYFVCMAVLLAKKLLFLNDGRVMVYARDHDEPSRISHDRDPLCSYQAVLHIGEELNKRGRFADLYPYYFYLVYLHLFGGLMDCKTEEKEKEFYQFLQEKGMDAICSVNRECYDKLDDDIKSVLEQYKEKDFNSQWYREKWGLKRELNQPYNTAAVISMFAGYRELHKAVGIWGAGANGVSLLEFCREKGLPIDMVVDKSEQKQGQVVEGYIVEPPENIGDRLQVIILTARYIYENVIDELSGRDIEVIDINQMLWMY